MRIESEISSRFAPREELDRRQSFFLVGIGGAGMSALANMLRLRGFQVRGSDAQASAATEALIEQGIEVAIGHSAPKLTRSDALVVSDAIDLDSSPEYAAAATAGCPCFRRSQVLGWLLRRHKTIAIVGTHGKTTTTGMVGAALRASGMDPLVVVGAHVPEFGGSVVEGEGAWAVVEACEAYDSLRDIDPTVVVLTNLELDHVDFHGTYDNLRECVLRFVRRIPADGALIYCDEDAGARDVAERFEGRKVAYRHEPVDLALSGRHQELNASGAKAAAAFVGADGPLAREGIAKFRGAERRLQTVYDGDIVVVDDYAHHPTEIAASIEALRAAHPGRRLVVVYQPHLYSRTAPLIAEFAQALNAADLVVLTDIYPAREASMPGVSSARIAELLTVPTMYVPSRHRLPQEVAAAVRTGDVVCGMGAGNISDFAPAFVAELNRGEPRNVAVIYGGDSAEREVSLHSGIAVHEALKRKGYSSQLFDVAEALLGSGDLSKLIGPNRPDVAFLAVHGTRAEDGAIQGLLELLGIAYTGSGLQSSAIAMDKALAKQILVRAGLKCPRGWLLETPEDPTIVDIDAMSLVVKPNAQGSTVGLGFVNDATQLKEAIRRAAQYGSQILVEERIVGMEVSVPTLGDRALPPVEIVPKSGAYDFEAKYTPGATEEIVPARLPAPTLEKLKRQAEGAVRALGCKGAARTDMMVADPTGDEPQIYILEVNTIPGMTPTSLLPNSAKADGIEFDDLVAWMVEDALKGSARQA